MATRADRDEEKGLCGTVHTVPIRNGDFGSILSYQRACVEAEKIDRRAVQAELFVCAVACSGFLELKLGQEDPRTGTQGAQ